MKEQEIRDLKAELEQVDYAELCKNNDVVLCCLEKDAEHCHRTLLAKDLVQFYDVDYRGEL